MLIDKLRKLNTTLTARKLTLILFISSVLILLFLGFQNFTGINTIVSRKVSNSNEIYSGNFGFDELSLKGDDPGGSKRGQVSPDGKIWIRFDQIQGSTWTIATVKPLTKGVSIDPNTGNINNFNLDQILGPRIKMGSSGQFVNDNTFYPYITFNYGLGGLSFQPESSP